MLRIVFIYVIRLYWILIPEQKRRQCLFKESCSHAVFYAARDHGAGQALRLLIYRIEACHSKTRIFINPATNETNLLLINGECIPEAEVNPRLIQTGLRTWKIDWNRMG